MNGIHHLYAREIHAKLGYMATWMPNEPLRLGDVGRVRNHIFERITNLEQMNIKFVPRDESVEADYEYISSNKVIIRLKAAGQPRLAESMLTKAEAGINIRFQHKDAIVFQSQQCNVTSILDQETLGKEIILLYQKDEWPSDYHVITTLVRSKATTVLISNGKEGNIDLSINKAAPSIATIADVTAELRIVQAVDIGTKIVAAKDLTPLFKLSFLKPGVFKKPRLAHRGDPHPANMMTDHDTVVEFVELRYEDVDSNESPPS